MITLIVLLCLSLGILHGAVPTKQYIKYLNELKPVDKKFIIEDLDSTHLLVKKKARDEISRKVEAWMDEVSEQVFEEQA